ncbi:tautomerase family protein [Mycobacterium sp. URHB0044]|jgi:4-oxalocrotonate tautomerase|uniref:tautomerase family protein n=1 Tax=Mycobacterium sp. URHB0044 TaxID=1380386 RepID=UPI0004916511|nr:tautomerase family protein [Mycobacterium sp. URHB0044]
MPLIEVSLAQGRSEQQIRTMIHEVHEAVLRTIDTRPEYIRVIVREVPRTHWATGDVTLSEMQSRHGSDPKASGTEEES